MADVYFFPTKSTEFVISIPLSVMEALACGVPVIGYKNFKNLGEIMEKKGAIKLIDDTNQLDEVVDELLEKRSNHSLLEKALSWSEVACDVLKIIREEKI